MSCGGTYKNSGVGSINRLIGRGQAPRIWEGVSRNTGSRSSDGQPGLHAAVVPGGSSQSRHHRRKLAHPETYRSEPGCVVGTYSIGGVGGIVEGFLLSEGQFSPIAVPFSGAVGTSAVGINSLGEIVGTYKTVPGTSPAGLGFLLSHSMYSQLSVPFVGATDTAAMGINNSGQVVGNYSKGGTSRGFLMNGSSYFEIDVPFEGSYATVPRAINSAGQIVGWYVDDTGEHGFLATPSPVPLPASAWLFGSGLLMLLGWRRRAERAERRGRAVLWICPRSS
jgi:hypothetical protein